MEKEILREMQGLLEDINLAEITSHAVAYRLEDKNDYAPAISD